MGINNPDSSKTALTSDGVLTKLLQQLNITQWEDAISYVSSLPYGRNQNRYDVSMVLRNEKGTCSSKHALLYEIAKENNIPSVELILCIYLMTENNTVGIRPVLTENNIAEIPEAHCYLKINGTRKDYTTSGSNLDLIIPSILEEINIEAQQIGQFKVDYHKNNMKKWLVEKELSYSFEDLWNIRESCILQLSKAR